MTTKLQFRTPFTPRVSVSIDFKESKNLTRSEQAPATDINNIVNKFYKTGVIDYVSNNEPQFGDFTNINFEEIQNKVAQGNQLFESLPAHVRKEFNNNPAEFIEFIQVKGNIEDMRDGEIDGVEKTPKSPPETQPVEPTVTE